MQATSTATPSDPGPALRDRTVLLAAVVTGVTAALSRDDTGFVVALATATAALVAVGVLLRRGRLDVQQGGLALVAFAVLPMVGQHLATAAAGGPGLDAADGRLLVLQGLRLAVVLAAGVCLVLPPRWSLPVGLLVTATCVGAVPPLAGIAADEVAPELLRSTAAGLLVVLFVQVLARTSSLMSTSSADSQQRLEDRRRMQAMAAHDIRGPLAIAHSALETMATHGERLGPDTTRDLLRVTEDAVRRAAALSDDLLDESLGRAPRQTAVPVVVGELVTRAAALSRLRDGEVRVHGGDVTVTTSPDRVERIVVNLLDNAFKHGAPPVDVDVTVGPTSWQLSVADAGDGIDERFADRAFDALSRHDTGRTDGVGLGLHIVAAFAESLGGSVAIDAEHPGPGARFVVTLPLQTDAA